jgi:hypothetical protein
MRPVGDFPRCRCGLVIVSWGNVVGPFMAGCDQVLTFDL